MKELKRAKIVPDVSCLYIKRIADRELAAVGMWDESVVIFSLPDFEFLTRTYFSTKPESVLICEFEGIPHLLCGLRDGHLLIFTFDQDTYKLTNLKEGSCGSLPITLRTYSAKNTTLVFAASERPFVIYSNKKILLEDKLDLKDICNMCPFNSAAFPESIAVAGSDELTICRIDYQMIQILSIQVQNVPRCFCYQDYSRTFAFCSESTEHIGCIDLLNDQSFEIISSYSLEKLEVGVSIVSCSLSHSNDNNVYYCVGTGYSDSDLDEDEERKGRILVFEVENRELVLVAKKEFSVRVRSLTPFNGKVLACLDDSENPHNFMDIHLYMLHGGGLQLESKINVPTYSSNRDPSLKARGNVIVGVRGFMTHILNKPETGDFRLIAGNYKSELSGPSKAVHCLFNGNRSVAIEVLNDDLFLRADGMCNICTFKKDNDVCSNHIVHGKELHAYGVQDILMDGRFHLGYQVTHFWLGSLLQMPDSTVRQIPTLVFGTLEGVIGVMASLPLDDFSLLLDLQSKLREFIKGVGDFSHEQFRSYYSTENAYPGTKMEVEDDHEMCRTFIDGDFIELFLNLPSTRRQEVAEAMNEPVEELTSQR